MVDTGPVLSTIAGAGVGRRTVQIQNYGMLVRRDADFGSNVGGLARDMEGFKRAATDKKPSPLNRT